MGAYAPMCYRCHGDMLPEASDPGTLMCQICGHTAETVAYDEDDAVRIFYEEIREKSRQITKHSHASSGRKRKKPQPKPALTWMAE